MMGRGEGGLHTLEPTPNIRAMEPVTHASSRASEGIGPWIILEWMFVCEDLYRVYLAEDGFHCASVLSTVFIRWAQ